MKKKNRILNFFILLFMLAWNPVVWKLLYGKQPVYQSILFTSLFWILPASGILLIILGRKKEWSPAFQNLILTLSITSVFFIFLVGFNKILGKWLAYQEKLKPTTGIIFTPHSKAHYKTTEFEYTANINNVGLRNRDISAEKKDGTYRILCFGDSWTFGWGLENEFSWPEQLNKILHEKGFTHVEVINCGQGGQYTQTYKEYLNKALPLLKPDLVLIGVLQIDDLAQLYEQHATLPSYMKSKNKGKFNQLFTNFGKTVKSFMYASFSNYIKILNRSPKEKMQIQKNWEESSQKMISSFTPLQKLRFETFPDSVKFMFRTGNLNPGMVTYYLDFPDRTLIFNNPGHPATQFAIDRMKKDFKEMKSACGRYNSKIAFINLPINTFTGHDVIRNSGDEMNEYFRKNNHIDSIYRSVAQSQKIAYTELTGFFDALPDKTGYFFKYDGHPTAKGQNVIALNIGDFLINNQDFNKLKPN